MARLRRDGRGVENHALYHAGRPGECAPPVPQPKARSLPRRKLRLVRLALPLSHTSPSSQTRAMSITEERRGDSHDNNKHKTNRIEVVTLTGIETFRNGCCSTASYFTATTPVGESASIHFEGRISVMLNCLTSTRIKRQRISLKLLDCSHYPRSRFGYTQVKSADKNRQLFFKEVQFADTSMQQVYEDVRANQNASVGARMDAILSRKISAAA